MSILYQNIVISKDYGNHLIFLKVIIYTCKNISLVTLLTQKRNVQNIAMNMYRLHVCDNILWLNCAIIA